MKHRPTLRCPNGCKTVADDSKFVEFYGPNNTPLYRCLKCKCRFSARHDSIFFGFHTNEQTIYRVLKALAEGNGIRACSRIFDIDKKTVTRMLDVAGVHCQRVNDQLIQNYQMEECQLDELWSFVKKRKRGFQPLKN